MNSDDLPVEPTEIQSAEELAVEYAQPGKHDPYAALKWRDFRLYISGNFLSITGLYMQSTAVLWEIHRARPRSRRWGSRRCRWDWWAWFRWRRSFRWRYLPGM